MTRPSKAELYTLQGNIEIALTCLEKAIQTNERQRDLAKIEPIFDPIRSDPRFQALLKTN